VEALRLVGTTCHQDPLLPKQHEEFLYLRPILKTAGVALQVETFGNSNGTNYKLDYTTYSNAFSFHFSAFQFMSNDEHDVTGVDSTSVFR
jgi:hypothetical protein